MVATATIASLLGLYEWQGQRLLVAAETRSDMKTVRALGNALWPVHGKFIQSVGKMTTEELRNDPNQAALLQSVKGAVRELQVLKVKLFSPLDGRVVFSTEFKQIGDVNAHSLALLEALKGKESSDLSHREKFNSIDGVIFNRDVVGTYVPYYAEGRSGIDTKPSMIVEIYSDVTDRLNEHKNSRLKVVAGVSGTLLLLYFGVYLYGRKAAKALTKADLQRQIDEQRIRHQAFHDALTGLPNRAGFEEFIRSHNRPKASDGAGVLFVDLDRFKQVNDSLGHKAGDLVLQVISERIKATLAPADVLFRNGGDEFIVITRQSDGRNLGRLADLLVDAVKEPIPIDGTEVCLTVSVGMARWPADNPNLEEVVRFADMAMYTAKKAGENQVEFYRPEMKRELDERLLILTGLQKAFERSEFVLYYQPRLNASSRKVESVEALLRWQHPKMGLMQPGRFIAVLEDSPLIVDVGHWVIRNACEQAVRWHADGFSHLRVSVNVAARQFRQTNFVKSVRDTLKLTGLAAEFLELELTESQLMTDLNGVSKTLTELQQIGVLVSIDDFGTGYSSLSYLHTLPINCLKIDRSFVVSIADDARRSSIAKTISILGHNLGLTVVAEGVETQSQADILTGWGCEQLQGFLFSKPVPSEQIAALLKKEQVSDKRTPKRQHREVAIS
jgi:diguanylate cyclase (GGDEF)-like protein